jgi:hypothetical protein
MGDLFNNDNDSSVKIRPEVLKNDGSNWITWEDSFRLLLQSKDLEMYIEPTGVRERTVDEIQAIKIKREVIEPQPDQSTPTDKQQQSSSSSSSSSSLSKEDEEDKQPTSSIKQPRADPSSARRKASPHKHPALQDRTRSMDSA